MNLQVSVVLLFISLTGGYSLKCYSCTSVLTAGSCGVNITCPDGQTSCISTTIESPNGSATTKGCAVCAPGTVEAAGVKTRCCNTDLCNAADGVYKGSFLLLVSPLLFYFLFQ
ncbi:cytotoxin 7-like isoform X3 [Pimephales promelas]|uniref:cytotoxin 7-like isoform X2 n=1 Tax=Pimephales promelas TaxID=90988 RepID=UPI001955F04D|nr:cytotoxin 7-like isoform X2 [Pimephales promelas]XP_039512058.1 cytotoxin 7-like isoform X3 [Pimephales promelas]KAG1955330.1 hypothetical protein F2P79_008424 [Pimephales promelas]